MCFSLQWLQQICTWIVIVCACVAIIRLLIPIVLAEIGTLGAFGTFIVGVVRILLWATVAIVCIYFVFELLSCLLGAGLSIHLPRAR